MKAKKYRSKIFEYINQNIKSTEVAAILKDSDFNEYAYFYNCYPYLFVEAFEGIESKQLEMLNIASFLCYKAIVLKDDYIDKTTPDVIDARKAEISRHFLDEAKKILLELYGKESSFWMYWQKRKLELDSTNELDRLFTVDHLEIDQYETFADNKSAFAKLALDGLHVLSQENNKDTHAALIISHRHFSIAMQLFDDLFDVEEDSKNKQFNLAIHNVSKFIKIKNLNEVFVDANEIEKHLFLSDIATDMLQKALLHLDNSEHYAKPFKVRKWIDILNFYRKYLKVF